MKRIYRIAVVDDEPEMINKILETVKMRIAQAGHDVEFLVLSKRNDLERLNTQAADIVMFDCAMSAGDFVFQDGSESNYGMTILKRYREKNKRTSIIFYSGGYHFDDDETIKLTTQDFINIINELNVFAIVNHDTTMMAKYIVKAIRQMEPVLTGMDELILTYGNQGVFTIGGNEYSTEQIMDELRRGTEIGDVFRKQVNEIILTYLMRFKG